MLRPAVVAAALALAPLPGLAADAGDPLASDVWPELAHGFLGDGPVVYDEALRLVMPDWVEDSHSVPVVIKLTDDLGPVSEIYLFAENNPIQAAVQVFPRRPLQAVGMNIRLEQSTPVRAAALDAAGVWHVASVAVTVNSPGGCSTLSAGAGAGALGEIAMTRFERAGGASRLKVRISHPMHTGFAADDAGEPIPAFYIDHVRIEDEAGPIADMATWAALAADPSFFFDLAEGRKTVRVTAGDTEGHAFAASEPADAM